MFVKPKTGLKIGDPATRTDLPPEGKEVPRNSFWIRRLNDGDVIEVAPATAAPAVEAEDVAYVKDEAVESRPFKTKR